MPSFLSALLALSVTPLAGFEVAVSGAPPSVRGHAARQDAPEGAVACSLLEDVVPELFGIDAKAVTFRPSSLRRQDTCRANWAPSEEPGDQANQVRLTILDTAYDSPEAAVASLESTVASSGSGDWVEEVGDRAIQNDTSVQVAANARRFTVSVSIADDPAESRERTLELARELADRM